MSFKESKPGQFHVETKAELDRFMTTYSNRKVVIFTQTNDIDSSVRDSNTFRAVIKLGEESSLAAYLNHSIELTDEMMREHGYIFAFYNIATSDTFEMTYDASSVSVLNMASGCLGGIIISGCGPFAQLLADKGFFA